MKKIFTYNQNNVDRKSKICFSCIPSNQQEILIQHIEEMGGEIVNELTKKTSFLIASKINTEKVMAAMKYNIKVVNDEFVIDCFKQKKFLDHKNYFLKPLQGLSLFILSNESFSESNEVQEFDKDKENYIGNDKIDKKGLRARENSRSKSCSSVDSKTLSSRKKTMSFNQLIQSMGGHITKDVKAFDYMIVMKDFYLDIENSMMQKYGNVILTEDWINECSNKKKFVNPSDYKYSVEVFNHTFSELKLDFDLLELRQLPKIFLNKVFYISKEINKDLRELVLRCISIGCGIYYKKLNLMVNYIITQDSNFDSSMYLGNSTINDNSIEIVTPYFVIKSVQLNELQDSKKFFPCSSLSYLDPMSNNNSDDHTKNNHLIISNIFSQIKFFIYKVTYSDYEYERISTGIIENSGLLIQDTQYMYKVNYIIINDEYSNLSKTIIEECPRHIKEKPIIVSHRYIEFCLEKREKINISKDRYFHIFPMPYKVPLNCMKDITLRFEGFNLKEKHKMELLAEMMGANIAKSDTYTHVIVEHEDDNKVKSIVEKLKQKSVLNKRYINSVFVRTEWLTECLFKGELVQENQYKI